eukprot:m.248834 g.248834  ORF g.248834 m.248834 type:complete len:366 (-) comp62798_c0_seq1:22-1119(-)
MGPHHVFTRAMAKHLEELRTIARLHFEAPGFARWGESGPRFPLIGSRRVAKLVDHRMKELGCTKENTLFAASVCSDELNHEHGDICTSLEAYWSECFGLGGLAGAPFTGLAGFRAFRDHVPHDGNLFILFAPHVGVSPDGRIGRYARRGQLVTDRLSNTCGAAVGALAAARAAIENQGEGDLSKKLNTGDAYSDPLLDFQINWLKKNLAAQLLQRDEASGPTPRMQRLATHLDEWKASHGHEITADGRADSEQAVLSRAMYDIIATSMESIIAAGMALPSVSVTPVPPSPSNPASASRPGRQVVYLLGGIQVNVSDIHVADPHAAPEHVHSDLFLPMLFEAREWYQGRPGTVTSLMNVFNGIHVD